MRNSISIILLISLISGCDFFGSDKFYSCVETNQERNDKFSVVLKGSSVLVNQSRYERCKSDDVTLTFSDDCKNMNIGTLGTLNLVTGEFSSTYKENNDSKVSLYIKGSCSRVKDL